MVGLESIVWRVLRSKTRWVLGGNGEPGSRKREGEPHAILHPAVLYQNFAGAWDDITERHVLAEPWANETRHSRVDYRDVAEVAAIALLKDRLVNGTFELCAEGSLDRYEIAVLLSDI